MSNNNITELLMTLHSTLSASGGYILLGPKDATYPFVTYTVLNSVESPIKSFTSEGEVFTVQFSYFSDNSIMDCLTLNTHVTSALDSLSACFDVSTGNYTTIGNTEQHKFYQLIDTRDIEIIKEVVQPSPPPPSPILYYFTGSIDGDVENLNNYSPVGIPIDIDNVIVDNDTVNMPDTGTLTCSTLTVNDPDNVALVIANIIIVAENVIFNDSSVNYDIITTATFNNSSINAAAVTTATFNDSSNNYGVIETATFNNNSVNYVNSGAVTAATFNHTSINYGTVTTATFNNSSVNVDIITTATFNDSSNNIGIITTATYIPLSIGIDQWSYPTNIGTINTANIYWLQADNELSGTITTPNYLGYPNI